MSKEYQMEVELVKNYRFHFCVHKFVGCVKQIMKIYETGIARIKCNWL